VSTSGEAAHLSNVILTEATSATEQRFVIAGQGRKQVVEAQAQLSLLAIVGHNPNLLQSR
jgi:hypothetical protein